MSQNHHSALGQRSNGDPRREMSGEGDVHTDPASLFSVFPPVIYTPTARGESSSDGNKLQLTREVAQHIAPHTVVYPSPASSSDLYPQHADMFNMLDDPRSFEDWAARRAAEDQVKALLRNAGPGYVQQ